MFFLVIPTVLLSEIKAYGKKESTARKFLNHFNDWKKDVENASKEYNFYDKQNEIISVIDKELNSKKLERVIL